MGTQAMASQTGGGRPSPVRGLARQGSLYSLTLNEVQSHLGEPLHCMNLDDLLKNVLAAGGDSHSYAGSCGLNRALSKMTVDEVWRDIQQQRKNNGGGSSEPGEMTLEDFLMNAGVVAQGPHWLHQYQHTQALGVGSSCAILETVFPEGQTGLPSPLVGAVSDPLTPGRKRGAREDVEEKTVERRQKRMIKNRESAARSRARKQAYTNELENKVSRLEEENERLRKRKELEMILHSVAPAPEPKHQLRRSISASF